MEQRLVCVCQRDVDHHGRRHGEEPCPERAAQVPGVVGVEVSEYQRGVDAGDGCELGGVSSLALECGGENVRLEGESGLVELVLPW